MLNGWIARWLVIAAFFGAAASSRSYEGMPYWFDGWLALSFRDFRHLKYLPYIVLGVTLVAEVLGRWLPPQSPVLAPQRRRAIAIALIVVSLPLLWTLRFRGWLGDLNNIDKGIFPLKMVETAEPLGSTTYYFAMWTADRIGIKWSTAVCALSVLFGATAMAAIFLWAEVVTMQWLLAFLAIISTGATLLFYGYPEKGTPKSVALTCWYLYAGTRALRGQRNWDHVSSFLLSIATLMHGSVASLLPAHALFIWRGAGALRGVLGGIIYVLPMILMFAGVQYGYLTFGGHPAGNLAAPTFWFKEYCITNCGYDFISRHHFTDIVNCLFILAPVAVLAFPEAVWHSRGSVERWLLLGSLGCLFLSIVWFPTFGYRADWDIFAITPLMLSYFTIQVAVRHMPPTGFNRFAAAWIVCSAIHAVSWWRFFTPGIG